MNTKSIHSNKNIVGYLFILPSLLILLLFVIVPLINSLVLSFFDYDIMMTNFEAVGLKNYKAVLNEPRFWNSMKNTLYFTIIVVPLQNILSLIVAVALKKTTKLNIMFRTIYFLPVVCSMTIIALSLSMMVNYNIGIIPAAMRSFGLPVVDLINDVRYAMPTVMAISIYKSFGYTMVIFIASLQGVDPSLYEASEIDGASRLAQFFNVTLPCIMPTITFTVITSLIGSFQVFDQVYVTTKGGPMFSTETAVQLIYERAFGTFELGFANANAFLLFLVILIATLISKQIEGRN